MLSFYAILISARCACECHLQRMRRSRRSALAEARDAYVPRGIYGYMIEYCKWPAFALLMVSLGQARVFGPSLTTLAHCASRGAADLRAQQDGGVGERWETQEASVR